MTNDATNDLIPFRFDRIFQFDETTPAAVLLAERAGDRFLAIRIGRREAAALKIALDSAEERDHNDDRAVVISGLVDGTFRSHIESGADRRSAATPVRTADALAFALRWSLPVYVQRDIALLACVHQVPIDQVAADAPFAAAAEPPILSVPYARMRLMLCWTLVMRLLSVAIILHLFWSVISTLSQFGIAHLSASYIVESLIVLPLAALLLVKNVRSFRSISKITLDVFPAGIRFRGGGKFRLDVPWSSFKDIGPIRRPLMSEEAARFVAPIRVRFIRIGRVRIKGFVLKDFDPNWRSGELGRLIRLYAPHVLGVAPIDPDGGSVAF